MADSKPTFRLKSRTEQMVEMRHGAPVDALLRRYYIEAAMSQEQVATVLGVSRTTVLDWMAAYGIPTRDRRKVAA
jgi:predicted XRE-type DNA-binding protein